MSTRVRFDEAALVRQHEGYTNVAVGAGEGGPAALEEEGPVMQDKVLERALSLLKGLGKVRGGIRR